MSLLRVVLTNNLTIITDDTPFFKELIDNGISKVRVVKTIITFVKNSNRVPTF